MGARATPRQLAMRYRSADHWLEVFQAWFGPAKVAFERVGPEGAKALAADLRALLEGANVDAETLVAPGEYLEIVAVRA